MTRVSIKLEHNEMRERERKDKREGEKIKKGEYQSK